MTARPSCSIHAVPLRCPSCDGASGGKAGDHARKGFASRPDVQAKARATRRKNKRFADRACNPSAKRSTLRAS
jgi:hypothetical protein